MGIEIRFEDNLEGVMKKIDSTAQDRILESVNEVRNTVLETLSGDRSGRVYKVPGTSKTYVASSPGQPPAVQLGDLRKSIKGGVEEEGGSIVGFVGTELPKGPMLEFGTSRMAARPWLRPSFEKSADKVKEILTRVWF